MATQDSLPRPSVIMEDDLIHTPQTPFCRDATCPCKEDQALLAELAQQVTAGLLTSAEATRLVAGQQV